MAPSVVNEFITHPRHLLGKLSTREFLRKHWQKKPVMIRGAYANMPRLVSPDELAGLSCEPDLVSRLILERGGRKAWEVRRGPFRPSTFSRLPAKHWTLLVNGVDRYVPAVHQLLDCFRFVPNWRIEDVMISYAVDKGNVGAHVDDFDVFLLQAEGRREWQIEDTRQETDDFREGLDIKLLKHFRPSHTWLLEPGDMLYLPPRFAHHGIARGDGCMTISVGFRAPSHAELLTSALGETFEKLHEGLRYADPDLAPQRPGALTKASLDRVRGALESALPNGLDFALWFGRLVTQPRDGMETAGTVGLTAGIVRRHARSGGEIFRNEGSRLAYYVERPDTVHLFVDGSTVLLEGSDARKVADLITDGTIIRSGAVASLLSTRLGSRTLLDLLHRGVLYLPDDVGAGSEGVGR